MEAALKAIAAPHRRQILSLVRDGELSAGEIASHFDVTRPAVSQHLNVLKEAGLVSERRNGTRRLYRARPEGLLPVKQFLEEFWSPGSKHSSARSNERRRSMDAATETTAVERELEIDASPETVWNFLVDPDKAVRWMGQNASFEPRRGGLYRVEVLPGNTAVGEFIELDPPRRLVFTWGWEPGGKGTLPPGSTTVEIELVPNGEGTTLRFKHHGLPDEAAAESHAHGWDHYLERLATAAAGGEPGRDPWLDGPMS